MQIRPAAADDLDAIDEIDATLDADAYLHVDRAGEGVEVSLKTQARPLREKRVEPHRVGDELRFTYKSVATGIEEGLWLWAEHDGRPAGSLLARPRPGIEGQAGTLDLLDVRVDYDFRRQGIASAMLFQAITAARGTCRAIYAEVPTSNLPAARLLEKLAFEAAGLDVMRRSNHDLVKEQATVFWYLALE